MVPEDLVEPYVSGGSLKFNLQEDALQGLSKGDGIKTAVNLYIPVSQMKQIYVNGVDQNIEVIYTNPSSLVELEFININDSGVDNRLYVTSPNSKVHYTGSGVNSKLQVEAASGSSIKISGVDQEVRIKTGEGLNVKMSGVDQTVYIEGGYERIKMSGVDNTAYVNGENRCDNIESSGVDNDCSLTEGTVVVQELSCLAWTKVGKYGCNSWWSTGAGIAVGAVSVVLLILLCIACCCGVKACVSSFQKAPCCGQEH